MPIKRSVFAMDLSSSNRSLCRDCLSARFDTASRPLLAKQLSIALNDRVEIESVRQLGPLALVELNHPMRANNNKHWVVLNGMPPLVDAETEVGKTKADWNEDYIAIHRSHPKASIFPTVLFLRTDKMSDQQTRLVFIAPIVDGCHACDIVGVAYYALDFDRSGKFLATRIVKIAPGNEQLWFREVHGSR